MIHPSHGVNIYIVTKAVDFRKGHDGLAALVQRGISNPSSYRGPIRIEPEFLPIKQSNVPKALAFRTFWIVLHAIIHIMIVAGDGRTLGWW